MTKETRLVMSEEMYEAIEELSTRTGQTKASIMREGIARYLMLQGFAFTQDIHPSWGGPRDTANPGKGEG